MALSGDGHTPGCRAGSGCWCYSGEQLDRAKEVEALRARVAELEQRLREADEEDARLQARCAQWERDWSEEYDKRVAAEASEAAARSGAVQWHEWAKEQERRAVDLEADLDMLRLTHAETLRQAVEAQQAFAESERKRADMLRDLIEIKTVARATCWDWAAKRDASEDYAQKRGWELLTKHVPDTE